MTYIESVSLRAGLPSAREPADCVEDVVSLMDRMVAGDEHALGEVFDRHAGRVYGLCLRVLREPADAEEVMQEIFLELWRRPERFDARRGSLRAYLSQLARSRAIDRLRQHRRRSEVMRMADAVLEHVTVSAAPRTPDGAALFAEQRRDVRDALMALSEPQRSALVLSYFDGLTYREIAERSGEPVGTIKTRVRRALLRLREQLVQWSEMTVAGEDEE
jgi:RNA polymerase sigma-70 factor (ECF subfamily)